MAKIQFDSHYENKFDALDNIRNSLNYWLTKSNFEFVKFVILLDESAYLGILGDKNSSGDDCSLAPLFLRNCPWKMEDTDTEDFNHKPWVVFLHGTDDSNYGKRFNAKKDALKWAQKQDILDPKKEKMFWVN